ncbi:MAG: hypothetical protein IRZ28_08970 [Steroidobacteraceae bacterium]|nr:hypothetical protein [Steroidobacteraceae bacterium]
MQEREIMRVAPESPRRIDEQRSYFPDWTLRLLEFREELEADHNSYLAGGYAEEFGYWAHPGASRGVPVVDGAPPENSAEWLGQAAAMHPGYPIRPYPFAADREPSEPHEGAASKPTFILASRETVFDFDSAADTAPRGTFVRVTERPYERERHHFAQRATALLTRTLAALVALQWELPRRRRATNVEAIGVEFTSLKR